MWNRIIHPRLFTGDFADLSDFYAHTCTIQEAAVAYDIMGEEVFTWGNLAGHVGLSCTIAPAGGREVKAPDMTYVVASHTVSIAGHYPTIQEKMRAVVDGTTTLDILLVSWDSQEDTTHMDCQLLT